LTQNAQGDDCAKEGELGVGIARALNSGKFKAILDARGDHRWEVQPLGNVAECVDGRPTLFIRLKPAPVITAQALAGSDLVWGGTCGIAGSTYHVLASTNVGRWCTNWVCVATNTFGADGSFAVTNALAPAQRNQFYCIQVP
jgi:hypothetical protein